MNNYHHLHGTKVTSVFLHICNKCSEKILVGERFSLKVLWNDGNLKNQESICLACSNRPLEIVENRREL